MPVEEQPFVERVAGMPSVKMVEPTGPQAGGELEPVHILQVGVASMPPAVAADGAIGPASESEGA